MLVRNAAELRELIGRVIADIEKHVLQGDTPLAFTPVRRVADAAPEGGRWITDVVSTYVESRLTGLGATSLREVGSRRPHRAGIPQRTDILVNARFGRRRWWS